MKQPMPIDADDEASKAITILKRFRKHLEPLPDEWKRWIVASLSAGLHREDE
jgi:hypothetical protein